MLSPPFDSHRLRATAARFDTIAERSRVWAVSVQAAPELWRGAAAGGFHLETEAAAQGWRRCAEFCEQAAALIRAHAATAEHRLDDAARLLHRVERVLGVEP